MARHEDLTGLPGWVGFSQYLGEELAKAECAGQHLGLVRIDLDHDDGDQVSPADRNALLADLAGSLRERLEAEESLTLLDGDDWAAVIRFSDSARLHEFVERLAHCLQSSRVTGGIDSHLDASVGVAVYPADAASARRLLRNANLAMNVAKADIGRRVCFYGSLIGTATARSRRTMARELLQAVDRDEFVIAYQIQKSFARGEAVGYEALLRWRHPERGLINPDEFIPIAEASGAITRIGEWVLWRACRDAARWPLLRKVCVNVSPLQLARDDLPDLVRSVLDRTGLAADRLELEITESAMIVDKARTLEILRRIRDLGVTLALDDFGVSYSSLEVLKWFPFDKIKLDRLFITGLPEDARSRGIVQAVLALGRSLSVSVLAEGVETQAQFDHLRAEGCDEAQGLLLGGPIFGEPSPSAQA